MSFPRVRGGSNSLTRTGPHSGEPREGLRAYRADHRELGQEADLDEGKRSDGLTTDDRAELAQLRRENRVLREERDILKQFAAWSAQEANWNTKKRSDS